MFTTSYKYRLSVVAALLVTSTLSAAQVGALTTFQAYTTAKASEVNNNFIVLKDAVNDNDTRLNVKQNRITQACGVGFYIRAINEDGTVVCQLDANTDSGGDITGVTPGYGLTGGGTSGTVTLNADTTKLQSRVGGSCNIGSSIRAIAPDGTVTCDQDTGSTGIEYKYYTSYSNFPTNGDIITLVYITMTVPSAGYIYLTATGMFESKHVDTKNTGYAAFGIMEDATHAIDTYHAGQSYREITPTMRHNESDWTYTLPFFTNNVAIVSHPGTYTYYFRAHRTRLDTQTANIYSMNMRNVSLTGIFVPKKY